LGVPIAFFPALNQQLERTNKLVARRVLKPSNIATFSTCAYAYHTSPFRVSLPAFYVQQSSQCNNAKYGKGVQEVFLGAVEVARLHAVERSTAPGCGRFVRFLADRGQAHFWQLVKRPD